MRMPKTIEQTRRLICFAQYFQKFTKSGNQTTTILKILRKESEFFLTDEHNKS